ncbi:hypothetical protein HMPREF9153_1498 [Cutibacterium avidum ATCC 25577]|uniref:Uncharacterized protein n=1 Tax=Cutibacterium avidum ATCC 25577 TaxID=997355 RepID=G4CY91_9ACTN|nr:hypothetical protein HMPREF9153_1498 [Cutibacterium avidum ATCC 25577]
MAPIQENTVMATGNARSQMRPERNHQMRGAPYPAPSIHS